MKTGGEGLARMTQIPSDAVEGQLVAREHTEGVWLIGYLRGDSLADAYEYTPQVVREPVRSYRRRWIDAVQCHLYERELERRAAEFQSALNAQPAPEQEGARDLIHTLEENGADSDLTTALHQIEDALESLALEQAREPLAEYSDQIQVGVIGRESLSDVLNKQSEQTRIAVEKMAATQEERKPSDPNCDCSVKRCHEEGCHLHWPHDRWCASLRTTTTQEDTQEDESPLEGLKRRDKLADQVRAALLSDDREAARALETRIREAMAATQDRQGCEHEASAGAYVYMLYGGGNLVICRCGAHKRQSVLGTWTDWRLPATARDTGEE